MHKAHTKNCRNKHRNGKNTDTGYLMIHMQLPLDLDPSTVPSALLNRAHIFQEFVDANEIDRKYIIMLTSYFQPMIVGISTGLSIGCLYALIYCLSLQGHT